jgi:hypothetical protein
LPNVNKLEKENLEKMNVASNEKLRIAWRYGQNQSVPAPNNDSQKQLLQPNYFFMNKYMSFDEVTKSSNVKTFEPSQTDLNECFQAGNPFILYSKLAQDIQSHIDSLNMNINKTKSYSNIMRIGTYFFHYQIFFCLKIHLIRSLF